MAKDSKTHPEVKGLALIALSLFTLLTLMSFHAMDSSQNWLGLIGHGLAFCCTYLFGLTVYPLLFFLLWIGFRLVVQGEVPRLKSKAIFFGGFMLSLALLLNLAAEKGLPLPGALRHKVITESLLLDFPYSHYANRHNLGGVPLYYLYRDLPSFNLKHLLSDLGIALTFSLIGIFSFLLLTETDLALLLEKLKSLKFNTKKLALEPYPRAAAAVAVAPPPPPPPLYELHKPASEVRIRTLAEKEKPKAAPPPLPTPRSGYTLPPPSLLTEAKKIDQPLLKKELKERAAILEETLFSFGIEAKVGEINCGPTITSFEIHPAVGVKVQKITALESNIALNLQAPSIRIIAPIPGKAAVGVEIPSPQPQPVSFKEMLLAYGQGGKKLHIPILLGKTVTGDNVISDLAKMPHCLIAGATGSGKSVCINTLVMSILMNAAPDEVKIIMVDPKKVELTQYAKLPHMIAPVITEPHGAYAALSWLVKEMQSRYDILKQLGLRNISAFNARSPNKELEASLSLPIPEKMYAIVAIIDEFADLMMASSSDLETPIARIAQMARAVGIHLVLATQRPSREVITGLIKANFPTRIAFKVASRVNSQIILDENGAETLLGNGDMLFLPPGSSHLVRAQGAYISDEEISRVISFICDQAPVNYLIPSFDAMTTELSGSEGMSEEGADPLYLEAKEIVLLSKNASTTFLQRKLKIGYARAASLIDALEANGVVSAQEGSKARRVLGAEIDE